MQKTLRLSAQAWIVGMTIASLGILSFAGNALATTTISANLDTDGSLVVDLTSTLTGVTTHGGNVISDTDSTDSLGTTGVRWLGTFSDGFTGNTLTLDGATGANEARLVTNLADSFSIEDTAGDLMVFDTTTAAQRVTITPATTITGLITATGGLTSGSNIISDTDSTDSLGSTGVRWANAFTDNLTGNTLTLDGATGANEVRLVTNLADSFSIEDTAGDLMVFDTTTAAQRVTITPALTVTGATTHTAAVGFDGGANPANAGDEALGTTALEWDGLYVGTDGVGVSFGADQDAKITWDTTNTNLEITGTNALVSIGAGADGDTATAEGDLLVQDGLEVDGATDLDGTLNVATTTTLTGVVTHGGNVISDT